MVENERIAHTWQYPGEEESLVTYEFRDVDGLSARLSDFVEEDLITRRSYDEIPPRVEYEATQKLRDLGPILEDIFAWWRDVDRHERQCFHR